MSTPTEEAVFEELPCLPGAPVGEDEDVFGPGGPAGHGPILRKGKRTLLRDNHWVEFSVYPKGKRISLDSRLVTSVSEGDEGEAIIAVKSEGQPHILIRLLDLYGPALRAVLLSREW